MRDDPFTRLLFRQRNAYRALFAPGPVRDIVLQDLRRFCRATSTPAQVSPITQQMDPISTARMIGRLEVWLRITQNINLSDADLYRLMENQNQQENDYA